MNLLSKAVNKFQNIYADQKQRIFLQIKVFTAPLSPEWQNYVKSRICSVIIASEFGRSCMGFSESV